MVESLIRSVITVGNSGFLQTKSSHLLVLLKTVLVDKDVKVCFQVANEF